MTRSAAELMAWIRALANFSLRSERASGGAFNGFGEEPNCPARFGVGFDIYQKRGELNNNHVSCIHGACSRTPVAVPTFDLADGISTGQPLLSYFTESTPGDVQVTPR